MSGNTKAKVTKTPGPPPEPPDAVITRPEGTPLPRPTGGTGAEFMSVPYDIVEHRG